MNDDKCEFCKGTGKEEGQAGCVWCFNTGRKDGQKLLTPPAEQHQGDPVAWMREDGRDAWTAEKKSDAIAHNGTPGAAIAAKYTQPLYTHADPGEVERLRKELGNTQALLDQANYHKAQRGETIDALRAQLAALRELKLPEFLKLSDEMRAAGDHAEQRAREDQCYSVPVLKAVFFEAAIQRWLDDQEEALSASAEPSAPAQEVVRQTNDVRTFSYFVAQGEERAPCPFCGGKVQAPVYAPGGHDPTFTITCNCGCKYGPDYTAEACERGWNRRAIEPEQKKVAMRWCAALQQCAELLGMQCGDDLTGVPEKLKSALATVPRDERAEFEKRFGPGTWGHIDYTNEQIGWKCRAALERKP